MIQSVDFNGSLHRDDSLLISANNRGFRYGDGIFETMRTRDGMILLANLHFDRLFSALAVLKFQVPEYMTGSFLEGRVHTLCKKKFDHLNRNC